MALVMHHPPADSATRRSLCRCWHSALGTLAILACGGASEEETAMDSPTGSEDPTAEFLMCLGSEPHDRVDALAADELIAACRNYRACDALAFSSDEACRFEASVGAKQAATDATTIDELRKDCADRYQDCVASPDAALHALSDVLENLKARDCRVPADCGADFGELAQCAAAMRQATSEAFPDCGLLTKNTPIGESEIPQECGALGGDCIELLLAPGE